MARDLEAFRTLLAKVAEVIAQTQGGQQPEIEVFDNIPQFFASLTMQQTCVTDGKWLAIGKGTNKKNRALRQASYLLRKLYIGENIVRLELYVRSGAKVDALRQGVQHILEPK